MILLAFIPYVFLILWCRRNVREDNRLMAAKQHKSEWRQLTEEERAELDYLLTLDEFEIAISKP